MLGSRNQFAARPIVYGTLSDVSPSAVSDHAMPRSSSTVPKRRLAGERIA